MGIIGSCLEDSQEQEKCEDFVTTSSLPVERVYYHPSTGIKCNPQDEHWRIKVVIARDEGYKSGYIEGKTDGYRQGYRQGYEMRLQEYRKQLISYIDTYASAYDEYEYATDQEIETVCKQTMSNAVDLIQQSLLNGISFDKTMLDNYDEDIKDSLISKIFYGRVSPYEQSE